MYPYQIRPVSGQEFAKQQLERQKASQINPNSLGSAVFFLHSFLSTHKRIRNGALSLLAASLVAVLSGCGGMTYNKSSAPTGAVTLSKISCGTQTLTGAQSQACSVSLSAPATSATTVSLTSSNAALTVPASVVVATGAQTAAFNAVSTSVNQTVSVTITGKANGASATDVIALNPAQAGTSAVTLSKVSCGTQSLTGAQSKDCTVSLSAPATSATTVSLTSSNAALTVPASVVVAAGAETAGFNAVSSSVNQSVSVTITGTMSGVSATDAITLYPSAASAAASTVSKVACGTQTLTGPTTEACTVYVTVAPTSPTSVTLSSSNGVLTVPTSVTIAAGATSASFSAKAAAVTSTQTVTLTATANGASATDVIQVTGTSASQPTQHQVDLSWEVPNPTSDPVVGYHVYRAPSNSSSYTLLSSSVDTQTSYTDTSVQSGSTYAYMVKSVDSKGVESTPSNTTSVTVP